jgi:hypothetical protein
VQLLLCSALHVLQEQGLKLRALHDAAAANSTGPLQGLTPMLLQHFMQRQQQQLAGKPPASFPASSSLAGFLNTTTAPSQLFPIGSGKAAAAAAPGPCWVDPQQFGSQLAVSEALAEVQPLLALSCKPQVSTDPRSIQVILNESTAYNHPLHSKGIPYVTTL